MQRNCAAASELCDDAFELLHYACMRHTDGEQHENATIGTCWDADRLDLGRVGIIPSPELMSTDFGREIAKYGSIEPFVKSRDTKKSTAYDDGGAKKLCQTIAHHLATSATSGPQRTTSHKLSTA
jgi:hypothetical protein